MMRFEIQMTEAEAREYVKLWEGAIGIGVGALVARQIEEQLPPTFVPGDYVALVDTIGECTHERVVLKVADHAVHYVVLGTLGVHAASPRELVKVAKR